MSYEVGFSSFRPEFTSLYLEQPFDKVSSLSNEKCALLPYSGLPTDLNITSSVTDDLCIITIASEIVYLNHEILDQYSDKSKPTLYKIS